MISKNFDFLIIGAGIIGLSVARELTERYPAAKIAIVEKETQLGLHASGRNSGVLHSGIYYPTESLKASVCSEGAKRMYAFAKEHDIPCEKVGKVIIATQPDDINTIDFLLKNARQNNIVAHKLNATEIFKLEPYASPYEWGIYTPDTAAIDSKKTLAKLHEIIISRGVNVFFKHQVIAVDGKKKSAKTTQGHLQFGYLFNCAGAGTDQIAKMLGFATDFRLLPFKGIYYKLHPAKKHLVKGNIYPVPDLKLPFLGVHFTKGIHGDVYAGPTAMPALGRENYQLLKGMRLEAFRIIKDIAMMYFANQQNFRLTLHAELCKYYKPYFTRSAKKLIATIKSEDLLPSNKVGIRPQLINLAKRKIEMDYIIEQDAQSMHVLNAISPAFTGAFAFAELLVKRM